MKLNSEIFSTKVTTNKEGYLLYPLALGIMFMTLLIMLVVIMSTFENFYLKKTITDKMEEILETKFVYSQEEDKMYYKSYNEETSEVEKIQVNNTDEIENLGNQEIKKVIEGELKKAIQEAAQNLVDNGICFSMMRKLANKELYKKYGQVEEPVKTYDSKGNETVTIKYYDDTEIGIEVNFKVKRINYTVTEDGGREIIQGDINNGNIIMYSGLKFISKITIKYSYPVFFKFLKQDKMIKSNGEEIKRIHIENEYIKSI